jgi:HAD superfamily hydrolase (TIGR01509 family)
MTAYDLIIFDLDGVLVDSEGLSCGVLQALLAEEGIALDLPEIHTRFLGRGFHAVVEHYRAVHAVAPPADFRSRFDAAVATAFTESLQPISGVRDLLEALPMPFCLASSSGLQRIELSLTLTGLRPLFGDRIFAGEMVPRGKPAPDLFLHAAKAMGVSPGRCLVIEDSGPGITAGNAAGMTVWGFAGGGHLADADAPRRLSAFGAARVFAKMADLQSALLG